MTKTNTLTTADKAFYGTDVLRGSFARRFCRWIFAVLVLTLATSGLAIASTVEMHTNKGLIVIEVNEEKAPISAANFVQYAKDGFFDGMIFHRIIPGFMIQGGGFKTGMKEQKTRAPIENESANGLKNVKYSLSMARTKDPNSATSQFFINIADNVFLDRSPSSVGYAVFGKVIAGTEVVDEIARESTSNAGHHQNVPINDVIIEKATVQEATQ